MVLLLMSALSIAHGAVSVNALPPGPTRQVPLPHATPSLGYGPTAPAPPSLSGGRRYTLLRFSGRRRRSGDGNGSTATLMVVPGNPALRRRRRDDAVMPTTDRHGHLCRSLGLLECGVCGLWLWLWYVLWRVLWCLSLIVCVAVACDHELRM